MLRGMAATAPTASEDVRSNLRSSITFASDST
jgi:hypothetical protein